MSLRLPLLVTFALVAAPAALQAQSSNEFFEKKIRPVLAASCYKCHSSQSEKLKGGLKLDSRDAMMKGGDSGAAIEPGNPEKSLIIQMVTTSDPDKQMPPRGKLTAQAVADLTTWVKQGAAWPAGAQRSLPVLKANGPTNVSGIGYDQLKKEHWAWQPVKPQQPAVVKNASWATSDIDKFVLNKLESKGLKPVADADRGVLIRRVTYDLTGLPPTPEDVDAFIKDTSADSYEKLVDRLLASPQYGERWGRHWLDVVRYSESTGSARNYPYTHAWKYRDYVIDSFNKDKPYNRFVEEQIAGDLMGSTTSAQKNEQLIATGFLAMGVKDLNEKDGFKYQMDNVDEQLDVMSRSILATTLSCARCHDHKFDAIPTTDYYAMAGIFMSTEILAGVQHKGKGGAKKYDDPNAYVKLAAVPAQTIGATTPGTVKITGSVVSKLDAPKSGKQQQANKKGKQGYAGPPAKPNEAASATLAIGVRDVNPMNARICIKGETENLGPAVQRGYTSLIRVRSAPSLNSARSGRLELSRWLSSQDNPLTARVMTNRIWQHLFGQGIVRTVDNFGTTGDMPSHPELLDYLTTQFIKNGWSVKKTIKQVVMSHTYRLGGTYDTANAAIDPGSQLLWRMNPRRLEAEALRDSMLMASGKINLTRPFGSPIMSRPLTELRNKGSRDNTSFLSEDTKGSRSVYLPVVRDLVPEALDVFDFAEPTMVMGNREVTTVATQALYMLNNTFVMEQSRGLASRVLAEKALDDAGRVDRAYRIALSRPASIQEKQRAASYIAAYARDTAQSAKDPSKATNDAWNSFCQALLASAEFRYVN